MNPVLIEPTDVLFFREAIPMSAGRGKGAGCRLPFPSTLHEAFRSSLLHANDRTPGAKREAGRPRHAPKRGNWHDQDWPEKDRRLIATRDYRSLRTVGPLPFLAPDRDGKPLVWKEHRFGHETGVQVTYAGLLLPVPADAAFETKERIETDANGRERRWFERAALGRLQLWRDPDRPARQALQQPADFRALSLPVAVTPPDKHGQLSGWWTCAQYQAYLEAASERSGRKANSNERFHPLPTSDLWAAEHRVGVQIDPASFASAEGQLYAGSYLRPNRYTRFVAWAEIANPAGARNGEASARERERKQLDKLDWLLLGGEFRLARLWHQTEDGQDFADPLGELHAVPAPPSDEGPCLLKWVLVTPAIFTHGSLPGWCWNDSDGRPPGEVRLGASKRKGNHEPLPGRAQLISGCLGKPRTVSGWDMLANDGRGAAKPTMLAVPEGAVYYFLCENRQTAAALARKLHWQPRSDFYGEKGCGYGLVSYDVQMHPTSATLEQLARKMFP